MTSRLSCYVDSTTDGGWPKPRSRGRNGSGISKPQSRAIHAAVTLPTRSPTRAICSRLGRVERKDPVPPAGNRSRRGLYYLRGAGSAIAMCLHVEPAMSPVCHRVVDQQREHRTDDGSDDAGCL